MPRNSPKSAPMAAAELAIWKGDAVCHSVAGAMGASLDELKDLTSFKLAVALEMGSTWPRLTKAQIVALRYVVDETAISVYKYMVDYYPPVKTLLEHKLIEPIGDDRYIPTSAGIDYLSCIT